MPPTTPHRCPCPGQVVGRVSSGDEVLDAINALSTDPSDAPFQVRAGLVVMVGWVGAGGGWAGHCPAGAAACQLERVLPAASSHPIPAICPKRDSAPFCSSAALACPACPPHPPPPHPLPTPPDLPSFTSPHPLLTFLPSSRLPLAQRVVIARSGFTNAAGSFEDFDESGAGRGQETAEQLAARLKREASQARAAVK